MVILSERHRTFQAHTIVTLFARMRIGNLIAANWTDGLLVAFAIGGINHKPVIWVSHFIVI